ncbi:hypothetical protein CQ13_09460 [Bradyrhizobium retamae]|uniref:Uncharacterized protein n=1 Tax=Bradyrhizobium retamae TaxID=1300035 RepID=A0A0R3MEY3_9BRAD|nr:hypothetical protein CQ13_09460 [Bradyrhizobium retamae]
MIVVNFPRRPQSAAVKKWLWAEDRASPVFEFEGCVTIRADPAGYNVRLGDNLRAARCLLMVLR